MKKKLAVVVGALSAVYMFVPEPSDAVPILGWLDEGMAGAMLLWSLKTLQITPSTVLAKITGKKAGEEDGALGKALDAGLNARLNKVKAQATTS